jgi:hypothetical protein
MVLENQSKMKTNNKKTKQTSTANNHPKSIILQTKQNWKTRTTTSPN